MEQGVDGGRWNWRERGRFAGREGENYGQSVGGGAGCGGGEVDWLMSTGDGLQCPLLSPEVR